MSIGRDHAVSAVEAIYASPLAADAVFTPAGGPAVELRTIPRMIDEEVLDQFGMPTIAKGRFLMMLSSVVARPVRGDAIEILPGAGAQPGVYPVTEDAISTDRFQLEWKVRVGEPA